MVIVATIKSSNYSTIKKVIVVRASLEDIVFVDDSGEIVFAPAEIVSNDTMIFKINDVVARNGDQFLTEMYGWVNKTQLEQIIIGRIREHAKYTNIRLAKDFKVDFDQFYKSF